MTNTNTKQRTLSLEERIDMRNANWSKLDYDVLAESIEKLEKEIAEDKAKV